MQSSGSAEKPIELGKIFESIIEKGSMNWRKEIQTDFPSSLSSQKRFTVPFTDLTNVAFRDLFFNDFIHNQKTACTDDLFYFVLFDSVSKKKKDERFFVRRREKSNPAAHIPDKNDATINWEETYYLNLIVHFEYFLEVTIKRKLPPPPALHGSSADLKPKTITLKKVSKKVYPSPNHVALDASEKASEVEDTYPFIYFRIDDFKECWKDIIMSHEEETISVELYAEPLKLTKERELPAIKLFSGSLSYDVVAKAYKDQQKMWQPNSTEFFKLRGPGGKGNAQLAVQHDPNANPLAPSEDADSADKKSSLWNPNWMKGMLGSWGVKSKYPLRCHLTFLCISTFSILHDLLAESDRK